MAILESTQIRALVDSVQDRDRDELCNVQHAREERTPLLKTTQRRKLKPRICCVKSKAALLVLCWNTLVTIFVGYFLEYGSVLATVFDYNYVIDSHANQLLTYAPAFFGTLALLYLFYPLAGCQADIRCGRYSTITNSLWFIIWGGVFTITGTTIMACYYNNRIISLQAVNVTVILAIGFGLPVFFGMMLLGVSYISFSANVIQFGMDQLHDSPAEDSVLFINWFVFSLHLGAGINKLAATSIINGSYWCYVHQHPPYTPLFIIGLHATPIVALLLLCISAWIARQKHQWFMVDRGSRNPYKLVYKVIKFAAQHKIPIHRSAFTYCEDELPSRMDLAKEKYGGPCTTEQVEDVKAFLGILQVLLTLSPVFIPNTAANDMLYKFSNHLHNNWYSHHTSSPDATHYLFIPIEYFEIGGLTETMIVILIPLYLCVLRPFIHRYIPGMLKRIGLRIIVRILSLLSVLIIDTIGHMQHSNDQCFLQQQSKSDLGISVHYLILPYILNALNAMLFYTAIYEFICAQSPHAMKGLLVGTFFSD